LIKLTLSQRKAL